MAKFPGEEDRRLNIPKIELFIDVLKSVLSSR